MRVTIGVCCVCVDADRYMELCAVFRMFLEIICQITYIR